MTTSITAPRSSWIRLAAAARDRRRELNLSQADVEILGGPSSFSISQIERAAQTAYRPDTLAKLEDALDWTTGTIAGLLTEPATPGATTPPVDDVVDAEIVDESEPAETVDTIRITRRLTVGDVAAAIDVLRTAGLGNVATYLGQQPMPVAA